MSFVSSNGICRVSASQASASTKLSFSQSSPPVSSTRCCETGRPIMIDPLTGSTICSCQMKTGIPAYLSRIPTLADSVYRPGTSPVFPPNVVMGNDPASALYAMGMKTDRQAEGLKAMTPSGVTPPFYLEQLMAANPYNAFYPGFDLNGARRKNATRETTSALKAWLYEHRKNPYPTKGEKIMLAIITRMTLTQVSTWFANARRRLKKEHKLDDKDDSFSDIDIEDRRDDDNSRLREGNPDDTVDLSDISDTEESPMRMCKSAGCSKTEVAATTQRPCYDISASSFSFRHTKAETKTSTSSANQTQSSTPCDIVPQNMTSGETPTQDSRSRDLKNSGSDIIRPKIWSISEIISKESDGQST